MELPGAAVTWNQNQKVNYLEESCSRFLQSWGDHPLLVFLWQLDMNVIAHKSLAATQVWQYAHVLDMCLSVDPLSFLDFVLRHFPSSHFLPWLLSETTVSCWGTRAAVAWRWEYLPLKHNKANLSTQIFLFVCEQSSSQATFSYATSNT